MAPAKGNKHGVGYGRPPEAYQDEDLIKLGHDMRAWMKEMDAKNEPVAFLSEFYCLKEYIPRGTWQSLIERKCFAPYYEEAKQWLSARIVKLNQIKESYGNRILGMYSTDVDSYEDAKMRRKADYESEKRMQETQRLATPVNDALIQEQHKNIRLQAELEEFKKELDALKRKAGHLICESDPAV